jgi:hypothetical protein
VRTVHLLWALLAAGCGGKVVVSVSEGPVRDARPQDDPVQSGDAAPPIRDASPEAADRARVEPCPPIRHASGPPVPVYEEAANYISNPRVVMDASGNAIAVWQQYGPDGWGDSIHAGYFDRTQGAWQDAVRLETATENAETPDVGFDDRGNAIVVWQQYEHFSSTRAVFASRYVATTSTWTAAEVVASMGTEAMLDPRIRVAPNGDAAVVWLEFQGGHRVYGTKFDVDRQAWRTPTLLRAESSGNPGYPRLAMDGSGNALAVWIEADGPDAGAYARRYRADGDTLDPLVRLGDAAPNSSLIDVALADDGNGIVVWARRTDAGQELWARRYAAPLGAWQDDILVEPSPGFASSPAVVAGPSGDAVVVWRQQTGGAATLAASRLDAGRSAFELAAPIPGASGDPLFVRTAMRAAGDAIAVWQEQGGERPWSYASTYDGAAHAWREAEALQPGADTSTQPEVAMDRCGRATIVWKHGGSGSGGVWAKRVE